jgi:tetratricopeptide (TPR) repeat protein
LAWFNKGLTPDNVAQARSFFDRALLADPDNVDALVESARAEAGAAGLLFVTDPMAALAAAETKLTKALSAVPDHAQGHLWLGYVDIFTKRVLDGTAECEHALELDRNLADAYHFIGIGKIFIGRAEETEAHIVQALRLSPRDTYSYVWTSVVGMAKNHRGSWEEAVAWSRRAIEANQNYPLSYIRSAAALAQLGRVDEARSALKVGLTLNPAYSLSCARALAMARSDDPTYLAQNERILEGLRRAGVPEQ